MLTMNQQTLVSHPGLSEKEAHASSKSVYRAIHPNQTYSDLIYIYI